MAKMAKPKLNPVLLSVVLIKPLQEDKEIGTATGFFFTRERRLFLVTNRHVALSEKRDFRPTHFRLHLHEDARDLRKSTWVTLPIYRKDGSPRWLEDPSGDSDILCLEVEEIRKRAAQKTLFISALSEADFVPGALGFELGQELLVIGYPRGYHDEFHNLPIIRYATLASPYPVPFQGKPLVLIDASLHPGTSGSPVILKPSSLPVRKRGDDPLSRRRVYLVGVHSSSVRATLKDGGKDPLGLHFAWFANLIPNIIVGKG